MSGTSRCHDTVSRYNARLCTLCHLQITKMHIVISQAGDLRTPVTPRHHKKGRGLHLLTSCGQLPLWRPALPLQRWQPSQPPAAFLTSGLPALAPHPRQLGTVPSGGPRNGLLCTTAPANARQTLLYILHVLCLHVIWTGNSREVHEQAQQQLLGFGHLHIELSAAGIC